MNNWEEKFNKVFINDNYIYSTGNLNSFDPIVIKLKKFIKDLLKKDRDELTKLGTIFDCNLYIETTDDEILDKIKKYLIDTNIKKATDFNRI